MAAKKKSGGSKTAANDTVVSSAGDTDLVLRQSSAGSDTKPQKAGEAGPKSSLETGKGSLTGASAGEGRDFEGRRGGDGSQKAQTYSVQIHTDEGGLEVFEVEGETGDEAAQKALEKKNFRGASVRGVTPVSDPDPNSLGGERDAAIMIADGENGGAVVNTLGTEANAETVEKLRKQDVKELGE